MVKKINVIGIDLGTTNSCVAMMESGGPNVIANSEGGRTTPSVCAEKADGEIIVGESAKRQAPTNPEYTYAYIKRFIGRTYDEVGKHNINVAYKVVKGDRGSVRIEGRNKKLISPEEISSWVLQKLSGVARDYMGLDPAENITLKAVITVPAYFNDAQRQATKDAGKIAGLDVIRIVNEPTAAALAYGFNKVKDQTIAVYDLGGGTFDISILHIADGLFEVKSTNGDTQLGGEDFDNALMEYVIKKFKSAESVDLSKDIYACERIREACEKAKKELSSSLTANINIPFITSVNSVPKHLQIEISRSEFEQLVDHLIERSIEPCKKALSDAKLSVGEIDEVILVGGMTRMPKVIQRVKEFFKKEPHKGVNPDEVVAMGAAIQGGIIEGDVHDILLLDVTPLSLGIETMGGVFTKLIERNTTIPTKKSQVFSTAADGQDTVTIKVHQGERAMASDNKLLAQFNLEGIPPAPRGMPQIEVTFDIDANGIVHVYAKDKGTGKEQKVVVQGASSLSDADIEKLVRDAEAMSEEDKKRKEFAEVLNSSRDLVYSTKKSLSEYGSKLSSSDKESIEEALKDLETLCESASQNDIENMKSKKEELSKRSMKLGEAMYASSNTNSDEAATGGTADSGSSNPNKNNDDDVVDTDYKEVDDKGEKR